MLSHAAIRCAAVMLFNLYSIRSLARFRSQIGGTSASPWKWKTTCIMQVSRYESIPLVSSDFWVGFISMIASWWLVIVAFHILVISCGYHQIKCPCLIAYGAVLNNRSLGIPVSPQLVTASCSRVIFMRTSYNHFIYVSASALVSSKIIILSMTDCEIKKLK